VITSLTTAVMCRRGCCCSVTARISVTSSVLAVEMLWLTMVMTSAGLSDVIDPCHPPVPCLENSNMSDPYGDCTAYYVCQSSHLLWQRMQCELENNETTQYDSVTGHCLLSNLQPKPTCQKQCPGESLNWKRVSWLVGWFVTLVVIS